MKTILKTEHLNKTYRLGSFPRNVDIQALKDVNITIESDEPVIVSVVGESGSGKTTLAKVILRLVEPTAGKAIIYDQPIAGEGAKPARADFLSMVQPIFQNPFEAFSRYRTIDSYLYETATRVKRLNKARAIEAMEEVLSSVGLEYKDVRGKYPNQFSGGELQRISVARALIPNPNILVADEPVSMIDASRRMIIINLFRSLKQEYQTSILYITHDLATAYYISDYIVVMNKGSIVEFGKARQVLSDPQHAYTRLLLSSIPTLKQKWERVRND
ncbi:ABC transporter ATP-binding protein [Dictyobacter sp. S3.2.2.5]|uniref:ABC transporter ATP-binding protein n=1 Tax=Dictyobacter halimunensis TaxID=3026934 RepID=A0ABQ6FKC5_9CHLR|nr:ABC transporter ATP-binding protein [Dictyobacter sp. S3.2.2.5]